MRHVPGRLRRCAALAAAAVLLTALPAVAAAAPWSAPQVLVGGHLGFWTPVDFPGAPPNSAFSFRTVPGLLGFSPGGTGIAIVGVDGGGRGIAAFRTATGAFGPVRASALGGVAPTQMAPDRREGITVAGAAVAPGDPVNRLNGTPLDAAAARGTLSGGFARRQILAHGVREIVRNGVTTGSAAPAVVVAFAANTAGVAAVVVSVPVMGRTRVAGFQARLMIRARGGSTFRRIADLGPRTVGHSPAALAVNGTGDVLAAWDDRTDVRARVITAAGRKGREQRLGQGGSAWVGGSRMSASIDDDRRMLVAWVAQRVGEGGYAGRPGIVAAAYAPPHGGFAPGQVLQRNLLQGWDRAIGGPEGLLLGDGGVVAWSGWVGRRLMVRTADLRSGRFGSPRELSPADRDAELGNVAAGPGGGLIATWVTSSRSRTSPTAPAGLFATPRAAGATAWGAAEQVASFPTVDALGGSTPVAVDPITGRALLAWSDAPVPGTAANPIPAPVAMRYSVRTNPDQ